MRADGDAYVTAFAHLWIYFDLLGFLWHSLNLNQPPSPRRYNGIYLTRKEDD